MSKLNSAFKWSNHLSQSSTSLQSWRRCLSSASISRKPAKTTTSSTRISQRSSSKSISKSLESSRELKSCAKPSMMTLAAIRVSRSANQHCTHSSLSVWRVRVMRACARVNNNTRSSASRTGLCRLRVRAWRIWCASLAILRSNTAFNRMSLSVKFSKLLPLIIRYSRMSACLCPSWMSWLLSLK